MKTTWEKMSRSEQDILILALGRLRIGDRTVKPLSRELKPPTGSAVRKVFLLLDGNETVMILIRHKKSPYGEIFGPNIVEVVFCCPYELEDLEQAVSGYNEYDFDPDHLLGLIKKEFIACGYINPATNRYYRAGDCVSVGIAQGSAKAQHRHHNYAE